MIRYEKSANDRRLISRPLAKLWGRLSYYNSICLSTLLHPLALDLLINLPVSGYEIIPFYATKMPSPNVAYSRAKKRPNYTNAAYLHIFSFFSFLTLEQ